MTIKAFGKTLGFSAALFAAGALPTTSAMADHHMEADGMEKALKAAVSDTNRADDAKRDAYRHPVETLHFFKVAPDMKVGEYAPGGGWYSKVLGNYLKDQGELVGLFFNPEVLTNRYGQGAADDAASFPGKVAEWTGTDASKVGGMTLNAVSDEDKGTFDRVLVFRMMHNMMRWNIADSEIKAMRELLKDDGMLGIVQHRAKADAPWSYADGNHGYLREADVIKLMEVNGFELVDSSEVNANPKDSADYEGGVWTLPPSYALGDRDKEKYAAIGESDRMTLLFKKAD